MGGALFLGAVLTTEPAGALSPPWIPPHVSRPVHTHGSGKSHAGGKSLVAFAASLAAGPYFARTKAREDLFDSSTPSFRSQSAVVPGAALTLTLGGRVGTRLVVGGVMTLGVGSLPDRFSGDREIYSALSVGPELMLLPPPDGGPFGFARGGVGKLEGLAWSAAVGGGYAFPMGQKGLVGLGLQVNGTYSRFGEDGDSGNFIYKDEMVGPALVARIML